MDKILWIRFCGQKLQSCKFYVQKFVDMIFVDKSNRDSKLFSYQSQSFFFFSIAVSYISYSHKVFPIQTCLGLCFLCPSKHWVKQFFELNSVLFPNVQMFFKVTYFQQTKRDTVKYKQKNDKGND